MGRVGVRRHAQKAYRGLGSDDQALERHHTNVYAKYLGFHRFDRLLGQYLECFKEKYI